MITTGPYPLPERVAGFRSRVINGLIDYVESLRPISTPSVRHEWRPGGVASFASGGAGGERQDVSAFRWTWASATTITVQPGAVAISGIGAWETITATVTLSGATAYVYAAQTKATRATIVAPTTLTTYPQSTAGEYRWAIWKFTSTDGGTTYRVERSCREDIRLGAPV
jgi:hypothetical protein